jgi:CDP-diglyceride synthetase
VVEFKLLLLLLVANGSPIVARGLLAGRLDWPLDGGATFTDGRRVFGHSKTVRGVAVSVIATGLAALVVSMPFTAGMLVGALAMIGDLSSSFVKRRLALAPGARVLGLDQIPESLLPAAVMMGAMGMGWTSVALVVLLFVVVDLLISPLLFRLQIRPER